eukprot:sb/3463425/
MAKRKDGRARTGNSKCPVTTADRKFEIPPLLKTEPIYVETPCPVVKIQTIPPGLEENDILFKCDGCGKPGSYLLKSGYKLVKTAILVEVGTQTGSNEITVDPVKMEITDPFYYDSVPTTSAALPIFDANNCDSDSAESMEYGEKEKEVNSFEDNMVLGLTDEAFIDSNEKEVVQQNSNSTKLPVPQSQILLRQSIDDQPTTSNRRKSTRTKINMPLLSPIPGSSSQSIGGEYPRKIATIKNDRTQLANDLFGNKTRILGYQCKIVNCSVIISSEKDLFEHVRNDHADRKYRCDVCPMAFTNPSRLTDHGMIHSGDKPHHCDECGMKFGMKFALKRHRNSTHDVKKVVSCRHQNCGMRLPKNELYEHIRTAHPKERFPGSICPMSFKSSGNLNMHMRKHNGIKPYECEVCGKKFSHSGSYKRHTVLHTGERPFKCDVCGKAFTQDSSMRRHMRTHTGEKPFPCSFCEKSFRIGSSESPATIADRKFEIPPLLKTEPINLEDNIKPAINSHCLVPNIIASSGAEDDKRITFTVTCDGCGKSGSGRLDPGYKLVKTAILVEVGLKLCPMKLQWIL